jgi:uroporphyrinogen-III decarboxylase
VTITSPIFLPVEVVFHPHWWHRNCGLDFDEPFFHDPDVRVEAERRMRQLLYDRFGGVGMGEKDAKPRPVIGPVHNGLGYVIPALLGCKVEFFPDSSPQVITADMTEEEILALDVPDVTKTWPMQEIINMMDFLESRYGYLEGDICCEGVQNVALYLRGNQLYVDYYENPSLAHHVLEIVTETILQVAKYVRSRTHTTSISCNRTLALLQPAIHMTANCSVTMISNGTYEEFILPYDKYLAEHLSPYGIHYCGTDMDRLLEGFAKVTGCEFFDVGWGSDVQACRGVFPHAWFNLRLSPVKLLTCTPDEVRSDTEKLLLAGKPLQNASVCCINMDYGTPDENVFAIYEAVEEFRRQGA